MPWVRALSSRDWKARRNCTGDRARLRPFSFGDNVRASASACPVTSEWSVAPVHERSHTRPSRKAGPTLKQNKKQETEHRETIPHLAAPPSDLGGPALQHPEASHDKRKQKHARNHDGNGDDERRRRRILLHAVWCAPPPPAPGGTARGPSPARDRPPPSGQHRVGSCTSGGSHTYLGTKRSCP